MAHTIERTGVTPVTGIEVEDLKLAASKMVGSERRSFQVAMAVKYCNGNPRRAETLFGWGRRSIELGLHERRTGLVCFSARPANSGKKLWEVAHPDAAEALWQIAQAHGQQDPTFRTSISYTRLTAAEALNQLRLLGFSAETLPSPSTMADVLNRNGYRLRPVIKAKPQKKFPRPTLSSPTSKKKTMWQGNPP